MAFDVVDALLDRIIKGGKWPPNCERRAWREVLTWRAFVESDREALKRIADWPGDREYKVDPLGERIADAWADHLFGEELVVEPGNESDKENLAEILEANDLTEDARAAERDLVVPEGEAWWRVYRDTDVSEDAPLIEWHSRASVAPYFVGKKLLAVALISLLEGPAIGRHGNNAIFRHFEIHVEGAVEHVLFRGTKDRIGTTIGLDAHTETLELAQTLGDGRRQGARWEHGGPMLMGRVINKRGRSPRLGKSEYQGIKDFLLDLNEAVTIGAENARLTAKKRIVVPPSSGALRPALPTGDELVDNGEGQLVPRSGKPLFNAGEDVLVADPTENELGRESSPFKVLEYSYDAAALIAHKRDLVESALTRVGLSPQWVGIRGEGDGFAASGTALRFRLVPTDKAGRGKARGWDREQPRSVLAAQYVHALAEGDGGFGRDYADSEAAPAIKRSNPLPTDEVEEATVESTLVGAGVRSRFTSIKRQNPEWSDPQVDEELDRLEAEGKRFNKGGAGIGDLGLDGPA